MAFLNGKYVLKQFRGNTAPSKVSAPVGNNDNMNGTGDKGDNKNMKGTAAGKSGGKVNKDGKDETLEAPEALVFAPEFPAMSVVCNAAASAPAPEALAPYAPATVFAPGMMGMTGQKNKTGKTGKTPSMAEAAEAEDITGKGKGQRQAPQRRHWQTLSS